MVSPLVSVPRIYHQKAMECARRVDRHWGKGTEVYLFCTEKAQNQELGMRVTTWCEMRVVRVNIIEKVF